MLPSRKKIGIIGGGQLGKMLIEASRPWNTYNIVLDEDKNCPASIIADTCINGSLLDAVALSFLSRQADVLTYEIEHINADCLIDLETQGAIIIPSPLILKIIQDKFLQKSFYFDNEFPTSTFSFIHDLSALEKYISLNQDEKFVIKSCKGGYDGKGVFVFNKNIHTLEDVKLEFPCIAETFIAYKKELAVLVARGLDGQIKSWPVVEMEFHPTANLVEYLFSPADISEQVAVNAVTLAEAVIEKFNGVGIFAVELFLDQDDQLFINEIAPRPHNSGHHTIESCYTSQFEQLNRILLGLPLGSCNLLKPAAMINLLGDANFQGEYKLENEEQLLSIEGVYIHLYNKSLSKPNRKLGHITILGDTIESIKKKAEKVQSLIKFSPFKKI